MKRLRVAGITTILAVVAIQALPIGGARTNPPTTHEPGWSSTQTRELFFRSCGDCHSNETQWPWFSRVAPGSWIVTKRVGRARGHLNVSMFSPSRHGEAAREAPAKILDGSMPPAAYLKMNPSARLTTEERTALISGLKSMPEFQ